MLLISSIPRWQPHVRLIVLMSASCDSYITHASWSSTIMFAWMDRVDSVFSKDMPAVVQAVLALFQEG
jgi:hypothetical protein